MLWRTALVTIFFATTVAFVSVFAAALSRMRKGYKTQSDDTDSYELEWAGRYSLIDEAVQSWCKRHSLTLLTRYKDYEIRTVTIQAEGKEAGIWIKPVEGEIVTIEVTASGRTEQITEPVDRIDSALDRAYELPMRNLV